MAIYCDRYIITRAAVRLPGKRGAPAAAAAAARGGGDGDGELQPQHAGTVDQRPSLLGSVAGAHRSPCGNKLPAFWSKPEEAPPSPLQLLDRETDDGMTALTVAAAAGHTETLNFLCEAGAALRAAAADGSAGAAAEQEQQTRRALALALANGHAGCARLLFSHLAPRGGAAGRRLGAA
eukprot:CAMPEP_0194665304 /NCGR_PEP_ID=MMETSP0295-20121207/2014_1 /TAXON_ID=39354 /ORGANISM="Heterosigma akashiwo, Strain CCMP2393" /LENGTH=178 /DNA_ID=CAMNT_0039547285 /DNA_START=351 /DNA_END=884 /DNA_ORIENTATION=+